MLSRTRLTAVAAVLCAAACDEPHPFVPETPPAPLRDIVDARNGGAPGFHFLPPIAPSPSGGTGALDASLLAHLTVEVCALQGDACLGPPVATFSSAGQGSERLRIEQDEGTHFHVNWHTGRGAVLDPDRHYRIRVLAAGTPLGHADVDVLRSGSEAAGVDRTRYVAVQRGSTLPIRFAIAQGAVGVAGPAGGTLVIAGGALTVEVASGTLDGPTAFTAVPVTGYPSGGLAVVGGTVWDLGPEDVLFDPPVTVTFAYDPASLGGADESQLRLHKLVSGAWEPVAGSTVDTEANTVSAPLSGFSPYGIIITPTGLALSGWGSATVDGAILPGEWSGAAQLAFQANLPGGGTATATLYVMNDAARLYLAVRIARSSQDPGSQASFTLDPGNDGTNQGDDQVGVQLLTGTTFEIDAFMNVGCGSFCADLDTDHGGTDDVEGALGNDGIHSVMEVSQELDGGDAGHDIAAAVGDLIGLGVFVALDGAAGAAHTSLPSGPFTLQVLVAAPPAAAVPVSAGHHATCGVTALGVGYCWGNNTYGGLGDGSNTVRHTPTKPLGNLTWSAITTGDNDDLTNGLGAHTCGLTTGGVAYCWGANHYGQLGTGVAGGPSNAPTAVSGGLTFQALSAGGSFACGLTASGAAYCWGLNNAGQLGTGALGGTQATPSAVAGGHVFGSISAGREHACGVTTAGAVYCWGAGTYGSLGHGVQAGSATPVQAGAGLGLTFASVAAGGEHTCALTSAGAAWCWGGNSYGQLGDGTTMLRTSPVPVNGGLTFTAIDAGTATGLPAAGHTCALTSGGTLWCWGLNVYGQLGDGTTDARHVPTAVSAAGLSFRALATGERHTCAAATGGTMYCWGLNGYGQLGDGTTDVRHVPTPVFGGLIF